MQKYRELGDCTLIGEHGLNEQFWLMYIESVQML